MGSRHQAKFNKPFSETYALCRVEGQKGQGFFVTLFPHPAGESKPVVEKWAGENGLKITWKNEVHFVLLDTRAHEISADGIKGNAAALVVKVTDDQNYAITLPAGGEATFRGQKLKSAVPVQLVVTNGKAMSSAGAKLAKPLK